MTKTERKHYINITARLEAVIEQLNKSISPLGTKDRICIICEQITVLRGILVEMRGDASNG